MTYDTIGDSVGMRGEKGRYETLFPTPTFPTPPLRKLWYNIR